AACDLRCRWCDTPYAFTGGQKRAVGGVVAGGEGLDCKVVGSTGGGALLPRGLYPLVDQLIEPGREVLVEEGGHIPIDDLPDAVVAIVDVKCPGSGEASKMHWPNLEGLSAHDEVKFVIADRADYEYAKDVVARHLLNDRARAVLFSPVFGELAP